ncbi:hypothetical protein ILUMI_22190 [Ignelater luminosus]|uniref:DNA replication ATP-dependent helicase/nuclease n=1 Tax=Ignelater luminosus TaxID=2038154 RepID=A0A8K0G0S0_IGNLU|nr:hypothetical protein ILUMI_22190 [Ignelater luminosus]
MMKKSSVKNKKPVKDNNKISSYFTRLVSGNKDGCSPKQISTNQLSSQKPTSEKENININNSPNRAVISLVDSDEDFIESTPKSENVKNMTTGAGKKLELTRNEKRDDNVLERIINLPKCSKSPDILLTPECKKRKHSKENTPSPDLIPCSLDPKEQSRYENFRSCISNVPPKKKIAKENDGGISVINLSNLPQEEFQRLHSPSKNHNDVKVLSDSPIRLKCKSPSELIDNNPMHSTPIKNPIQTPEKQITLKSSEKSNKRTPSKTKKISPTKLFSKSPKSLHKFNVEVIEKFVTITPSTSNAKEDTETACHSNVSARSLEIQQQNESTPTKSPQKKNVLVDPEQLKVKTKLNFDCDVACSEEVEDHGDKNVNELKDNINGSVNNMLNDSWDFDNVDAIEHTLDLNESQHCKIIEIQKSFNNIRLVVRSTKDNTTAICNVEGIWTYSILSVNDTIHISAIYDYPKSAWCVSNDFGLIVFEPDLLVSITSVVGATFCRRRSVFNEKYRGLESSSRSMVIGNLVHKLLQWVLRDNIIVLSEIEVTVKKLLLEKNTLWMLYESGSDMEDIEKELMEFAPRIVTFMKQYVREHAIGCFNEQKKKEDWNGKIDSIQDIEESIWCTELGVKGKVDVSIQSGLTTMPLELKTGRATVSAEHRGQVMFYIMMMKKFGYNVPSGLLLYLREGVLREIPATANEKRDLIMLRNELTYYLTRKPTIAESNPGSSCNPQDSLLHSELPPPINHHSACAKCPYNKICCTYLKFDNEDLKNNLLMNVQKDVLSHLEPAHLKYFVEWSSLLALEGSSNVGNKQLHEIYTLPPEKREKHGQCITFVTIKEILPECEGLYKHTFQRKTIDDHLVNLHSSGIGIGNYIVVSTNTRPAVAAGFVKQMDHHTITIALDRNLSKRYFNSTFHLDTYNSSISQTFNMTNLSLLLEPSEEAKKLREIIIDKKSPTFNNKLPKIVATKGTPILRPLNTMQQRAILKALSSNDYLLIKGMPGTGKTATIVSLVQLLVEINKSVLITSHTHSAVDNVCVRLQERGINILRLGVESKINPKLHMFSEHVVTKHCVMPQQLDEIYNNANVLAVTCLGSGHPALHKRQLDVCIVDESTQVLQCSVFRALYSARKFILIGDPDQLPPVVKNREAIARGLSESLFERLDNPKTTVTLCYNYRMNKPITAMANALTYNGQLLIANDEVGNATLTLPLKEEFSKKYENQQWIIKILDDNLASSIKILNTGPVWNRISTLQQQDAQNITLNEELVKCTNHYETAIVDKIVDALLEAGVPSSSIGIIAPYRAQVSQISLAIETKGVEVSTVDQFQGKDKEVIIYSCTKSCDITRSSSQTEFEILQDKRRLTVAITRAKHKFIMIGDLDTVRRYAPFEILLMWLQDYCFMNLEDGCLGFSWESIINLNYNNLVVT